MGLGASWHFIFRLIYNGTLLGAWLLLQVQNPGMIECNMFGNSTEKYVDWISANKKWVDMWRPHANAYIWCFTMPPRPGLWYYFAFVVWLLFTNLPPHVWHCKIPIAQSCFGVIFAHALVSQTRTLRTFLTSALLTFPTIKLVIAASLLCDPSLWDYPPGPRPYCSISINGKFWEVFSGA